MRAARHLSWLVAFAVGLPGTALAQVAAESAGQVRERFEEPVPRARPGRATLAPPAAAAPSAAVADAVLVRDIRIVGATVYPPAKLAPLYAGLIGTRQPLSTLYAAAERITALYHADGYALSKAVLPAQELDAAGAVVTIRVIEGYVDRVEWPTVRGHAGFFADYTARITASRPANMRTILRYLLLASDLPGLTVSSRFEGQDEATGATTLVVEVSEKPFAAEAEIDNRGTESEGPWQYTVRATENNRLGLNEALTLTWAGAFEVEELQYLALTSRHVLTSEGLSLFGHVSYTWGAPGVDIPVGFELQSTGLAAQAGLTTPVIRSEERNLWLSGLVFLSNDKDDVSSQPNSNDRLRGVRLVVDFEAADGFKGVNQVNAVLSQGIDGLGSTGNDNPFASRPNGRVDFTKVAATVSRVQPLVEGLSFRTAATGQYAFTPLLAPEECTYGGEEFGRAFEPSTLTGDSCFAVSGEIRLDVPTGVPAITLAQLYGFVDYGSVFRIDPAAGTPKRQSGASAGLGLRLGLNDRVSADLTAAVPIAGNLGDGWRYFLSAGAKY